MISFLYLKYIWNIIINKLHTCYKVLCSNSFCVITADKHRNISYSTAAYITEKNLRRIIKHLKSKLYSKKLQNDD